MKERKRYSKIKLLIGLAIFLSMIGVSIFILVLPYLDTVGVESVHCQVLDAEPGQSGGRGGRSPTVVIRTSDCGTFTWQKGVTTTNRQEVADGFQPGLYIFYVGWSSRVIAPWLPGGIPSVQSYDHVR